MSFLPVEEDSEQALEAALSFLADCERSTTWLLSSERDGGAGGGSDALGGSPGFDFFSPSPLASGSSDGLSSPSVCGDIDDHGEVTALSLAMAPSSGVNDGASWSMTEPEPELAPTPPTGLLRSSSMLVRSSQDNSRTRVQSAKPGKKPARRHSNRARDERRQELVYLRAKVAEMEARLQALKSKSAVGGAPSASNSHSRPHMTHAHTSNEPPSSSASAALAAVWGEMADRQYQERQKAERENVRLKMILERQIKMAKSLEKILKNRHNNQSAQSLGLNAKRIRRLSPSDVHMGGDKRAVLEMLLSGVEQAHREVDAVFEANGILRTDKPHRNAKVEHDAVTGIVMEIYANKVMPFDMHTTGRAVWRHFAHAKYDLPHRTYYEKQPMYMETDDNTIVESYGLELTEGHINANFHVKHILRRYFEADRIVIVWCTLTDTVEFRSQPTTGIRFLEKGYIILQRPQSASLPADCSLLKTCYIIRPDVYGDLPDQAQKIGALTDFALSSVSGTISTSHQMIENFLLAESLKK